MGKTPESGRRAFASADPRMVNEEGDKLIGKGSFLERTKTPQWIKDREDVYAAIATLRSKELESKTPTAITVSLPDGTIHDVNKKSGEKFESWKTTPYDVAASISQGLADSAVVARVTYADFVADYDPDEDGVGGSDSMEEEATEQHDHCSPDCECDKTIEDAGVIKPVLWDLSRPLGKAKSRPIC